MIFATKKIPNTGYISIVKEEHNQNSQGLYPSSTRQWPAVAYENTVSSCSSIQCWLECVHQNQKCIHWTGDRGVYIIFVCCCGYCYTRIHGCYTYRHADQLQYTTVATGELSKSIRGWNRNTCARISHFLKIYHQFRSYVVCQKAYLSNCSSVSLKQKFSITRRNSCRWILPSLL